MRRARFLKLLLTPSASSGMVVVLLAIISITSAGFLYVTENQLFYDYLFGKHGIATNLLRAPDSSTAIWEAVSHGPLAYFILLAAASIITGFTVFAVARGISWVLQTAPSYALQALQEARLAHKDAITQMFERLLVRVLGLIIAALYFILFIDVLIPLDMLLMQHGIDDLDAAKALEGSLKLAGSGILLGLFLHVHVVLARLYTLRLRIFGGVDLELAALDEA